MVDPNHEDEGDWSDDVDDWNEHVWSVAEFLPRSIPCWSHLKPEELPEEANFIMSTDNISSILADEVFEVIQLDAERDYKQSFMTFREFESQPRSDSVTASIREASIYKKL